MSQKCAFHPKSLSAKPVISNLCPAPTPGVSLSRPIPVHLPAQAPGVGEGSSPMLTPNPWTVGNRVEAEQGCEIAGFGEGPWGQKSAFLGHLCAWVEKKRVWLDKCLSSHMYNVRVSGWTCSCLSDWTCYECGHVVPLSVCECNQPWCPCIELSVCPAAHVPVCVCLSSHPCVHSSIHPSICPTISS